MKNINCIPFLFILCFFCAYSLVASQQAGEAKIGNAETSRYRMLRVRKYAYSVVKESYSPSNKYYNGYTMFFGEILSQHYEKEARVVDFPFDPDTAVVKERTREVLSDDILLGTLFKEMPDSLKKSVESFNLAFHIRNDGVILTLTISPKFNCDAGICYDREALEHIANRFSQYQSSLAWKDTDIALESCHMTFNVETFGKNIEKMEWNCLPLTNKESVPQYNCRLAQTYKHIVKLDTLNISIPKYPRDSMSIKAKAIATRSYNERTVLEKMMQLVPPNVKDEIDFFHLFMLVKKNGEIVSLHVEPFYMSHEEYDSDEYLWEIMFGSKSFASLDLFPRGYQLKEFISSLNELKVFTPWENEVADVDFLYIQNTICSNIHYQKKNKQETRQPKNKTKEKLKHSDVEELDEIYFNSVITDSIDSYSVKIDTASGFSNFLRCEIVKESVKNKIDCKNLWKRIEHETIKSLYNADLNAMYDILTRNIADSLKKHIHIYNCCVCTKDQEIVGLYFDLFFNYGSITKIPILYGKSDCRRLIKELNEISLVETWHEDGKDNINMFQEIILGDKRLNELKRKYKKRCFDRDKAKSLLKSAGKISANEEQ